MQQCEMTPKPLVSSRVSTVSAALIGISKDNCFMLDYKVGMDACGQITFITDSLAHASRTSNKFYSLLIYGYNRHSVLVAVCSHTLKVLILSVNVTLSNLLCQFSLALTSLGRFGDLLAVLVHRVAHGHDTLVAHG